MPNHEMMKQICEASFAVIDIQLFLDTHPASRAAKEALNQALKRRCEAVCNYEAYCGPLSIDSEMRTPEYRWVDTPWPWE